MDLTPPIEVIVEHLSKYSPSLNCFPDRYLPLFWNGTGDPPPHQAYVCPLCLKNWIRADERFGLNASADFTPDHYPPKSAANEFIFILLTCKDCNSGAGSNYDYSLKRKMQELSFQKKIPLSKVPATASISKVKGHYPGQFEIDEKGEMVVSFKPYNKIHAPFLDHWLEESKSNLDWKAELTIKSIDQAIVSKAMLKSAYLFCFEYWGYEFVFSISAEWIRKVLNNEIEYPVKDVSQWIDGHFQFDQGTKIPLGLCYIKNPVECRSFIVNMVLVDKETKYKSLASVLIPNPTNKGWTDLKQIEQVFSSSPKTNIEIDHLRGFSINERVLNGYSRSWEMISSLK